MCFHGIMVAMIFREGGSLRISSQRSLFEEQGAKQKKTWREINFLEYLGFRTHRHCHSPELGMDVVRYKVSSWKNVSKRCRWL